MLPLSIPICILYANTGQEAKMLFVNLNFQKANLNELQKSTHTQDPVQQPLFIHINKHLEECDYKQLTLPP